MDPRSKKGADKENCNKRSHEAGKNVAKPPSRNPLAAIDDANKRNCANPQRNVNVALDVKIACAVDLHKKNIRHSKNVEGENAAKIAAQPAKNNGRVIPRPAKFVLEENLRKRGNEVARYQEKYLYDVEYFAFNYSYMLEKELFYVILKSSLIERFEENIRIQTVNWLSYIHQRLRICRPAWFLTVRLMDWVISSSSFNKQYSLVGITSLWIASKLHHSDTVPVSTLCEIISGHHTKQEILEMEKEILRFTNFNLNCPDPTTFLFYYLNNEKLEKDRKTRLSAMFLLEAFTLTYEFSSTMPSLLAAIALYLALVKYSMNSDRFLKFITLHLVCEARFRQCLEKIKAASKKVLNERSAAQQVVEKYSKMENLYVAQNFVRVG